MSADPDPDRDADADSETETETEACADEDEDVLDAVFATVEDRKETLPDDSYTASLFTHEKGENAALEKLGEETTELVLAAKDDDREEVAAEGADLLYHLLVVLSMKGMHPDDLRAELRERF